MKLSCKTYWGIESEYTGMSSLKQRLNVVAENLKFLIKH